MNRWMLIVAEDEPLPTRQDRVVEVRLANADDHGWADHASDELLARGYAGEPIVLCVPAGWCMACRFNTKQASPRAWAFQMEGWLPLAAEQVAFDAVELGKNQAFGVAVERERLAALVRHIESRGLWVTQVTSLPLLLAQVCDQSNAVVVAARGDTVDVVALREDKPSAWLRLGSEACYAHQVQGLLTDSQTAWVVYGDPPVWSITACKTPISPMTFETGMQKIGERAQSATDERVGWIDLGQGGISSADRLRPLRSDLIIAFTCLFLLLIGTYWVLSARTAAYNRLAESERDEQPRLYREAFPGAGVPPAIHGRLVSEARKLRALSQLTRNREATPPALPALAAVLRRLPVAAIRVDRVTVDGARVRLEGVSDTLATVDAVATALRSGVGVSIESIQSEPRSDGVALTVELRVDSDPAAVRSEQ